MKAAQSRRRRTIALIVVAIAFVMDILDLTIVNVAIPTLQVRLGAGDGAVQWMVAGYATVFAVLLVTGGRFGDIFGYRRMLLLGAAGFTAASVACGLAPTPAALVVARLAQAGAAAMMVPQVMSLVQLLYPPEERMEALAVFGVLGGVAAISGPIIGGILIGADVLGLGWRMIFLINLPIGLLLVAAGLLVLPASRSRYAPAVDWGGTGLLTLALLALIVPLIEGRALGWPLWCLLLPLATPPLVLTLVRHGARRIARQRSVLLDPSLFRDRPYRLSLCVSLLFQAATASLLFTLSLTLQEGLGLSAAQAGLAHVPFALGSSLAIALLSRRLLPRLGSRVLLAGILTMGAGLALLCLFLLLGPQGGWFAVGIIPVMLALGLGMGLVAGPLTQIALAGIDVGHAGAASGLLKTVQETGGALGVAVIGTLYFSARRSAGASLDGEFVALGGIVAILIVAILPVARLSSPLRSNIRQGSGTARDR